MLYYLQFDDKFNLPDLIKHLLSVLFLFSDLFTFKSLHRPFNLILSDTH